MLCRRAVERRTRSGPVAGQAGGVSRAPLFFGAAEEGVPFELVGVITLCCGKAPLP
jgi:hypothetical protein